MLRDEDSLKGLKKGAAMNIGEQRRTIYIEPIEEPAPGPVTEPSPSIHPEPSNPLPELEPEPAR